VDDWCHQKLNPGQVLPPYKPFPNETTLISHIKERLDRAGKVVGDYLVGIFCSRFLCNFVRSGRMRWLQ
jgi:saccharopine dehydrogenase (NAD+, L-lysine-forming)